VTFTDGGHKIRWSARSFCNKILQKELIKNFDQFSKTWPCQRKGKSETNHPRIGENDIFSQMSQISNLKEKGNIISKIQFVGNFVTGV
jgi:hypothetical protein